MGISNDIKPRKVYYPGHTHYQQKSVEPSANFEIEKTEKPKTEEKNNIAHHKTAPHLTAKQIQERAEHKRQQEEEKHTVHQNHETIENDFFDDYNKEVKEDSEPTNQPKKPRIIHISPGKIIAAFFGILIIIMVVQNFSVIKSFFIPNQNKNSTKANTSTPVVPIEYTADDTNSSTSDDTSAENTNANNTTDNTSATTDQNNTTNAPASTTTPAATASSIDKSSIKLKVLNGNGIKGDAASVTTQLKNAGFTVSSTTNAKSFSYATSIIYYKTGKDQEAALVKESITGRSITLEQNDSATGTMDIVVVVGKE